MQSDCCNSVNSIWSLHGYTKTLEEAVALALNTGTQLCYECHLQEQDAVLAAVANGDVNQSTLDAAVARMLLTRFRHGEFDAKHPWSHVTSDQIDTPAARALAREAAGKTVVLATNVGGVLPIKSARLAKMKVAVIGPFADCGAACYVHSYGPTPSYHSSYLNATRQHVPTAAFSDGTNLTNATLAAAAASDLIILCLGIGQAESEGTDRLNLTFAPAQLELWSAVRKASSPSTTLILISASGGGVSFNSTVEAQADAILLAGYGGQEAGNGALDVITGALNPSARLPLTVYGTEYLSQVGPESNFSSTSGVGRTYRYLDSDASPPVFRFGYGLSFAQFRYSNLIVSPSTVMAPAPATAPATALLLSAVDVSVAVTNAGSVDGAEIVQIYVAVPPVAGLPTPRWSLQGFAKVPIRANETKRVEFQLNASQLSTVLHDGSSKVLPGTYTVHAGGGQPGDPRAQSKCVSGTLHLA